MVTNLKMIIPFPFPEFSEQANRKCEHEQVKRKNYNAADKNQLQPTNPSTWIHHLFNFMRFKTNRRLSSTANHKKKIILKKHIMQLEKPHPILERKSKESKYNKKKTQIFKTNRKPEKYRNEAKAHERG